MCKDFPSQGVHIILSGAEHILGRLVKEVCLFDSLNVNVINYKIFRKVYDVDGKI
jgi:hypothetical protein